VKKIPILGHEEEDHSVDEPKQLPVEILLLQLASLETNAKSLVRLVGDESGSKVLERLLNADAQLV
jgi:hypothetical protein